MMVKMLGHDSEGMQLDVSVRIMSYNRPGFLREAVESVLKQTKGPKDVQIFDNGSQDEVRRVVEDLLPRGITWNGSDRNRSPMWNFKRACEAIGTKYVYLMHDDDRLCPEFLVEQVDFLDKHPEVAAVASNAHKIDQEGARIGRLEHMDDGGDVQLFASWADVATLYLSEKFLPFPSIVYRTKALAKARLPQKRYGRPSDVVFLCDLANVGPIAFQNKDLFEYRVHPKQDTKGLSEDEQRTMEDYFYESALVHPDGKEQLLEQLAYNQTVRNIRRWAGLYFSSKDAIGVGRDFLSNRPRFFS